MSTPLLNGYGCMGSIGSVQEKRRRNNPGQSRDLHPAGGSMNAYNGKGNKLAKRNRDFMYVRMDEGTNE